MVCCVHDRNTRSLYNEFELNCKFKDIPNTVARASANVVKRKVAMFNIHADGGSEMMKAARIAVEDEASKLNIEKPALIAVTVLTSLSEEELTKELSVGVAMNDQVKRLANLAKEAGLDGVVASAREAELIRKEVGEDFLIVTPGIRPAWASKDDQSRIVTPKDALELGSSYLVVGRPITKAENRKVAAMNIVKEMEEPRTKN